MEASAVKIGNEIDPQSGNDILKLKDPAAAKTAVRITFAAMIFHCKEKSWIVDSSFLVEVLKENNLPRKRSLQWRVRRLSML